jgi:hypothetical protein
MIKIFASTVSQTLKFNKVPLCTFSNVRDALRKKLDEEVKYES